MTKNTKDRDMITSGKSETQRAALKRFVSVAHFFIRVDKPWFKRMAFFGGGVALGLILVPLVSYLLFYVYFMGKIYPGVGVASQDLQGLSIGLANERVGHMVNEYEQSWPISLSYEDNTWQLPAEVIFWKVDETIALAYGQGREGGFIENMKRQWCLLFNPINLPIGATIIPDQFEPVIHAMTEKINADEIVPSLEVVSEAVPGNKVKYHPGKPGIRLDKPELTKRILNKIGMLEAIEVELPVTVSQTVVTQAQIDATVARAERLLDKKLTLKVEGEEDVAWSLKDEELIVFVDFIKEYSLEKIQAYLYEAAAKVDREPTNAKFSFDNTKGRVVEFSAPKDGLKIDVIASSQLIRVNLELLENAGENILGMASDKLEPGVVELVVNRVEPEITLNDANDLGIKELIGRGVSTYKGSILSRVHNVELGASRLTGVLIKPGEEFSFNKAVGDVSGATGYQAAYVISNGRTELGDGGGICQDSTTVFRAALDAGLPITSRRGHSYRVGYYEQNAKAGLDATVYAPSTDFKFMNDTPAHILIQTTVDSPNRTLVVEIYGTSDGRSAEILNHVVYDLTPALPDQYIDDPTLGPGVVKQIDWAAGGAKAKFDYVVKRNGTVIHEKTFNSVYKPWSAKFLRGV